MSGCLEKEMTYGYDSMPGTSHQELFQAGFSGDYSLRQLSRQYILSEPPQINLDGSTGSKTSWWASFHWLRRWKPTDRQHALPGSFSHLDRPPPGGVFLKDLSVSSGPADVPAVQRWWFKSSQASSSPVALAWACSSRAGWWKGQPSSLLQQSASATMLGLWRAGKRSGVSCSMVANKSAN